MLQYLGYGIAAISVLAGIYCIFRANYLGGSAEKNKWTRGWLYWLGGLAIMFIGVNLGGFIAEGQWLFLQG